ncbi:MAG: glycine betaine ABC transporter substrate-binding protein [Rubrobacteraceae bacterium]
MKNRVMVRAVTTALLALALTTLAACGSGGGSGGQGSKGEITVGSKNFTEQVILGELYSQALEADGYDVNKRLDLGNVTVMDKALQSGEIDMYPEYTGTALVTALGYEGEQFDTPEGTYDKTKELYEERDPAATMLEQASFNNTYGIAVRKDVADEYGIKTLADLAEASPNLVFASFSEFQQRSDGFPNIEESYPATNFEDVKVVNDLGLRYQALSQGDADVAVGFTTDGQLRSDDLVVVEDQKNIWPFYHPAPVIKQEVLDNNEDIAGVINPVTESLDLETMQTLNGRVDLDNEDPSAVAEEYLTEEGLLE